MDVCVRVADAAKHDRWRESIPTLGHIRHD